MADAQDAEAARAGVIAILLEDVVGDDRELVLSHELYTLAAREPAYRSSPAHRMLRSRTALERHFAPETASLLDALMEGLTIHRALDPEARDPGEVERAITRIATA